MNAKCRIQNAELEKMKNVNLKMENNRIRFWLR
jgi:hypothetical protein